MRIIAILLFFFWGLASFGQTTEINLKKKKLTSIPDSVFLNPSITSLNLSKNKIDSIPNKIEKLKNINIDNESKNIEMISPSKGLDRNSRKSSLDPYIKKKENDSKDNDNEKANESERKKLMNTGDLSSHLENKSDIFVNKLEDFNRNHKENNINNTKYARIINMFLLKENYKGKNFSEIFTFISTLCNNNDNNNDFLKWVKYDGYPNIFINISKCKKFLEFTQISSNNNNDNIWNIPLFIKTKNSTKFFNFPEKFLKINLERGT